MAIELFESVICNSGYLNHGVVSKGISGLSYNLVFESGERVAAFESKMSTLPKSRKEWIHFINS